MSIDTLQEKIRALKNPSMVGLDPTPEVVPVASAPAAMLR